MSNYFDYASTTPIDPEIRRTYDQLLERYFVNADSIYPEGIEINTMMNKSRALIAELLNFRSDEIIFTSGASEANNMAIKGVAIRRSHLGKHMITTCVEHSSVLESFRWLEKYLGFEVTYLPVNEKGVISIDDLKKAMRSDTILVSVMAVNNESGAIMPIEEIKKVVAGYPDCYLHVDVVQAIGKMRIDLTGIDLASCSAHKIYGVKGSGFLMKKQSVEIAPLVSGGQQEMNLRGGTVNFAANTVFGKTLRMALDVMDEHYETVSQYHDYLYREISGIEDVVMNSPEDSSPYIINFSHLGIGSEVMMNALTSKGYLVSARSTCESAASFSHVISAMFKEENRLRGTIRVSIDASLSWQQIRGFVSALKEISEKYGKATV